ncbi:MAG: hypothetical protein RL662_200 [Bacteroidota bacterium]|jgi:uncharacterized protein (TIGR02145 family)
MKQLLIILIVSGITLFNTGCSKDPLNESNPSIMKLSEQMPIYYTEDNGTTYIAKYNAVRIGEYLWMNSNFTAPENTNYDLTQHQINRGLSIYRIDTLEYTLTPYDINKYIGQYYSIDQVANMNHVGTMHEGAYQTDRGKWGLPSKNDFRQLFAMCGNALEHNVRFALSYRVGEIPIMQKIKNIFWITDYNTNKYGFNLTYGGQRAHNDGFNWRLCHANPTECFNYDGKKGDFIIFYSTVVYPTNDLGTVMIHDYPDTSRGKEWALKTVRWCRKLSDEELGYKLYVNKDRTDIQKLGLTNPAPAGYEELANGYLRGFYVQYILNNPKPTMTVTDLRKMELELPDVVHGGARPT